MNGSNIPESWDDGDMEANADSLAQLNVSAKPFVPNVNATSFVPSFLKKPAAPVPAPPAEAETPQPPSTPVEPSNEESVAECENGDTHPKEVVEEQNEPEPPAPVEEVPVPDAEPEASTAPPVVPKEPLTVEDHLNMVFIGHVDAGKSTLGGQIMFLTGMVDKRTLDKYEREAKEKNRETWYLSWALDTNQEERDKGKTVEVGRAFFRTKTKQFTILDAPGHRSFVPNMIGGTSQADIAVLVISARRGEFETGFERGGQTREHAVLAKVSGVTHLIVLINKMDDSTVNWKEERYNECKKKLTPFLNKIGFSKNVTFMPCSGFTGANLKEGQPKNHPFYTGMPLIPFLDSLPTIKRDPSAPLRMPIIDRYKDMGVIVLGKLESGTVTKLQQLVLQPNRRKVKVGAILRNEVEVDMAVAGENVKLRLDGIEDDEISKGFVLCSADKLCSASAVFDAQITIIQYKSIITSGFKAIMHLHSCVEEVTIEKLICEIDRKTKEKKKLVLPCVKQDQTIIARLRTSGAVCVETFKNFPKMARLAIRDENITIAIGVVLKIIEE